MSEKKYQKNSSTAPLIATIIVALAAIVLAVVAILTLKQSGNTPQTSQPASGVFQPDAALVEECTYAAHDLVKDSYSVLRLFVTEGLPHLDEPYGNAPEDGLYTVNSTEYTSTAQIRELVNSVFVSDEADRIFTNIDGSGLAVYQDRTVLTDIVYTTEATNETEEQSRPLYRQETVLGISEKFTPADYSKDWSQCSIAILPESETSCKLTVYLGGVDPENLDGADPDSILETSMVKTDGVWKLTKLVY